MGKANDAPVSDKELKSFIAMQGRSARLWEHLGAQMTEVGDLGQMIAQRKSEIATLEGRARQAEQDTKDAEARAAEIEANGQQRADAILASAAEESRRAEEQLLRAQAIVEDAERQAQARLAEVAAREERLVGIAAELRDGRRDQ